MAKTMEMFATSMAKVAENMIGNNFVPQSQATPYYHASANANHAPLPMMTSAPPHMNPAPPAMMNPAPPHMTSAPPAMINHVPPSMNPAAPPLLNPGVAPMSCSPSINNRPMINDQNITQTIPDSNTVDNNGKTYANL